MMNLRFFITIIITLVSSPLFALSCPGNGNILKLDYSIQEAIASCGQPVLQEQTKKTIVTSEEWDYYKPVHQQNEKATFLFNNDKLTNINIVKTNSTEQNNRHSNFCGRPIQVGDNTNYVRSICGNPTNQQVLSARDVDVVKLTYDGAGRNTLVFENNKLIDWVF